MKAVRRDLSNNSNNALPPPFLVLHKLIGILTKLDLNVKQILVLYKLEE